LGICQFLVSVIRCTWGMYEKSWFWKLLSGSKPGRNNLT
jgi:hypothetical protein